MVVTVAGTEVGAGSTLLTRWFLESTNDMELFSELRIAHPRGCHKLALPRGEVGVPRYPPEMSHTSAVGMKKMEVEAEACSASRIRASR
jgi:hypothetical protein